MFINSPLFYLLLFWLAINLLAFILMLLDKIKASNPESRRISEGKLFFMATAFGALGVYAGMFACHHKTRKWYFLLGIPLLIIQNLTFFYFIYLLLSPSTAMLEFTF